MFLITLKKVIFLADLYWLYTLGRRMALSPEHMECHRVINLSAALSYRRKYTVMSRAQAQPKPSPSVGSLNAAEPIMDRSGCVPGALLKGLMGKTHQVENHESAACLGKYRIVEAPVRQEPSRGFFTRRKKKKCKRVCAEMGGFCCRNTCKGSANAPCSGCIKSCLICTACSGLV